MSEDIARPYPLPYQLEQADLKARRRARVFVVCGRCGRAYGTLMKAGDGYRHRVCPKGKH